MDRLHDFKVTDKLAYFWGGALAIGACLWLWSQVPESETFDRCFRN